MSWSVPPGIIVLDNRAFWGLLENQLQGALGQMRSVGSKLHGRAGRDRLQAFKAVVGRLKSTC